MEVHIKNVKGFWNVPENLCFLLHFSVKKNLRRRALLTINFVTQPKNN